jgi:hypothetical protein
MRKAQGRRHRSYRKQIIMVILSMELLLLSGILIYIKLAPSSEEKKEAVVNDMNVYGQKLAVEDEITTAPLAVGKNLTIWKGEQPKAIDFIENKEEIPRVKVSFEEAPDFSKVGTQPLNLILMDSSGKQTKLSVTLTVKEDKEPPVIHGARDLTVTIGDAISYKKGVTVTDNMDKKPSLTVDNSQVNLKKAGSYTVTYIAADQSGNKAKKTIQVQVKEPQITEELLNEKCDEVLAKILEKDMTKREQAYAIYRWIKNNISYSGASDKSSWISEAYRAISEYSGDCFSYYAVAQALLSRAEIDNMCVTRVGGRTKHYWNLVNCGDGWYHFDSCPNKDHKEAFMLTDKEVEKLTKARGNNYYTFDKSLYPATPEE